MPLVKSILAGAVALALSSGASAAILPASADVANNGAGSELILSVYNSVLQSSYSLDLGTTFNQGLSLANGTTWAPSATLSAFISGAGSLADLTWGVLAADSNPAGVGNDLSTYGRRYLGTAVGAAGNMQNLQLQSAAAAVNTFVGGLNGTPGHSGAANGEAVIELGNPGNYAPQLVNIELNTPFGDRAALGSTMDLVLYQQSGSLQFVPFPPPAGSFSYVSNAGDFTQAPLSLGSFDLAANGQLTFTTTAVPVPAAVWLLGSAVSALVGVRRRKNV